MVRKIRSWSLEGIEKHERCNFIIQCLQEYIDEVKKMDIADSPYREYNEICMVADLYQAIIDELSE